MKRDPRVDPKVGDVLRKGRVETTVTAVGHGRVAGVTFHPQFYPREVGSTLVRWRALKRDAEVIHAAD